MFAAEHTVRRDGFQEGRLSLRIEGNSVGPNSAQETVGPMCTEEFWNGVDDLATSPRKSFEVPLEYVPILHAG